MKIQTYILLALLFVNFNLFGQVDENSIYQEVLSSNITDSLYVFGQWNQKSETETHLRYLGIIKTEKENFKIMTSCYLWGEAKRATSRILIFSEKNKYLGNYYVGSIDNLPKKIENNQIVFFHSKNDDCDTNVINRLSFDTVIPKQFFLECKDGHGDIYVFDRE